MKWFIASDIHGSAHYCRKMLDNFKKEGADRMLLLGDILYHGPRNALPEEYDTCAVASMLNDYRDIILCIRGNCEAEVDQWVLNFPIIPDFLVLSEGGINIFATHGHRFNEENPPSGLGGGVLLHGHTHVPRCIEHENYVYMNPGSVSIPKENSPHGYMVAEGGLFLWKDLDGHEYMRCSLK